MPDTQQQQLDASQPLPPPPRVLTCLDGETLYFAYGANLALSTLKRRGVTPISRSPAVVVDPGVCLVFKHRGGYGSLAQLASLPEQAAKFPPYTGQAHGVVYQLSNADLKALAKFEGGYQLTDIEVRVGGGQGGWSCACALAALVVVVFCGGGAGQYGLSKAQLQPSPFSPAAARLTAPSLLCPHPTVTRTHTTGGDVRRVARARAHVCVRPARAAAARGGSH
jgi:hypothetical protein